MKKLPPLASFVPLVGSAGEALAVPGASASLTDYMYAAAIRSRYLSRRNTENIQRRQQ